MKAPILVYDHSRKIVAVVLTGPAADKKLAELAAARHQQIATSGLPASNH